MTSPADIALAIELSCRSNMHDAGVAIRDAVKAHCDGDYELAAGLLVKAIAYTCEAKKLCARQSPAAPETTAEPGLNL